MVTFLGTYECYGSYRLMKYQDINSENRKAFSLVQMAVIVSALGIMMTSGAVLGEKYLEKRRFEITDKRLKFVENAVIGYAARYGYFPCPSGLTETLGDIYNDSDTFHTERPSSQVVCAHAGVFTSADGGFYMGGVPWKELGLPYEYALDGWGRKSIYVMPNIFYEVMTVEAYSQEPLSHSGLVYWFDAANLSAYSLTGSVALDYHSVANNVKLTSLADANDSGTITLGASGTVGGDEPAFYVHESGADKFPVLRFDGVDDELEILGHSYSAAFNDMTLFVTTRYTSSDAPGETLISYDDTAYYELGIKDYATDKIEFYSTSTAGSDALDGPIITDYDDGSFHHFVAAFDHDDTTQIKLLADNVVEASGSPHETDLAIGVGTRYGLVGVQGAASSTPASSAAIGYFAGDIAEIILYNTRLSDANITSVYNYLNSKWGSNLINTEGPFLTLNDVSDAELTNEAVFALISTGSTGEGGYTKDGAALADPAGGETEYNNIPIASFPSTLYAVAERDSVNYRQRYSIDDFDDVVRYTTFAEIKEYKDNRRVN